MKPREKMSSSLCFPMFSAEASGTAGQRDSVCAPEKGEKRLGTRECYRQVAEAALLYGPLTGVLKKRMLTGRSQVFSFHCQQRLLEIVCRNTCCHHHTAAAWKEDGSNPKPLPVDG